MSQEELGKLTRVVIKGFKSIKECDLDLKNINVLIGANGAGKSNLISVFEMLQSVLAGELAYYIGKKGVETLFHNGKGATDSILAEFHFGVNMYSFELEWTEDNSILFREERLVTGNATWGDGGYGESKVREALNNDIFDKNIVESILKSSWCVYRFQDTTPSSRKKSEQYISNDIVLLPDGQNIAAFLYRLKESYPKEYARILWSVQLVAPFFGDFVLTPKELNNEQIVLRWQHKSSKEVLYASQLSDGTLRYICLAVLLLQPRELQHDIIIIDEPELGLHPFAEIIFAEMAQKTAVHKQVILATQSAELLECFETDDVVVVDRDENGSEFKRLDYAKLAEWLEDDYTLGDLWKKIILGGRFIRWNVY
jgi:predicted ATPase